MILYIAVMHVLRFVYNNNCQLRSDTMGMTMLATFTNDMLYIPISTALASFETTCSLITFPPLILFPHAWLKVETFE